MIPWAVILASALILHPLSAGTRIPAGEMGISANSTLPSGKYSDFSQDNLIEGTSVCWSKGAEVEGVGEYSRVDLWYFNTLEYILIQNGFGGQKQFAANARIKRMSITNGAEESRIVLLQDTKELQTVGLDQLHFDGETGVIGSGGLFGDEFSFEILEVSMVNGGRMHVLLKSISISGILLHLFLQINTFT